MKDKSIFAKNLETGRKLKKLSKGQMAIRMRKNKGAYSAHEEGRSEPSLKELPIICRILDIGINQLPGLLYEENFWQKSV